MELYHHPATKFVASFIGQPNMNFIPATVTGVSDAGVTVDMDGGHQMTLPVEGASGLVGSKVEVGIRPENVTLGDSGLDVDVRVLERLGGVSITYGTVAGHRFCASLPGDAAVREGQTMKLAIAPEDCHVFDESGNVLRRRSAPELVA
jgi:multiple sugar transport system ATP-binding protein